MTFRVKIRKEVIKELKKMPKAHLNRFLELKDIL
ncbi:mRNA-degrading endonuclease RelE of RelBE toxin-antitoxin system [Thermococcus stetteri]|nr:mRNA-degrading endonuclease RelE of RelBE toxin-antitoxin system [Thermococcus stetteri]